MNNSRHTILNHADKAVFNRLIGKGFEDICYIGRRLYMVTTDEAESTCLGVLSLDIAMLTISQGRQANLTEVARDWSLLLLTVISKAVGKEIELNGTGDLRHSNSHGCLAFLRRFLDNRCLDSNQLRMSQQLLNPILGDDCKAITLWQEVGSENIELTTILTIISRHSELRRARHVITIQELTERAFITAENISGITDKDIFFGIGVFITGNNLIT